MSLEEFIRSECNGFEIVSKCDYTTLQIEKYLNEKSYTEKSNSPGCWSFYQDGSCFLIIGRRGSI